MKTNPRTLTDSARVLLDAVKRGASKEERKRLARAEAKKVARRRRS